MTHGYISVSFKANEYTTAMLEALLMDAGFEGIEETESETIASIPEILFNEDELKVILDKFNVSYTIKKVMQQNWNAQWEQSFEPVQINDFAAIRADFHPAVKNVQHEIIITPKMSFGTGHHATTYLVVQEMSTINFSDKQVIDFGTGTGVLAILAEKMGAQHILAIDNDEWSINNAKENIAANDCTKITLLKTDEMVERASIKADIILANINLNVIIANIVRIKNACNTDSLIVLSGLLVQDEQQITEILTLNGLAVVSCDNKNNWIAILAKLI